MDPNLAKDWGLFAFLALFIIKQLFDMLRQSKADNREDVAAVVKRVNAFEAKFETKLDSLADKVMDVTLQAEKLFGALTVASARDVEFHDRQLPALEKRIRRMDYEVGSLRAGLNEVRYKSGLPPISQTPADGMPIHLGVPVEIPE